MFSLLVSVQGFDRLLAATSGDSALMPDHGCEARGALFHPQRAPGCSPPPWSWQLRQFARTGRRSCPAHLVPFPASSRVRSCSRSATRVLINRLLGGCCSSASVSITSPSGPPSQSKGFLGLLLPAFFSVRHHRFPWARAAAGNHLHTLTD